MRAFRSGAAPTAAPRTAPPIRLEFAQKAFILDGGRRLLLVRKSATDPHHPGRWEVPGGRLEVADDIDLDDHIRREVWEEVGLKIDPGPPFHLWQWFMADARPGPRDRPGQVRVVATARLCRPVTTEASVEHQTADDHLDEPAWVPLPELGGYELIPSLRPVIRAFLRLYPEHR
ncbi:NUDIX domain-containing protein [Actinomadura sp. 6N118]|uniref:NUDIX domain-containing protein n=1 Tax=Actinomadura sp. 6N118 TaxID=3375151 RepID=UPI0037B725EE